MERVGLSFGEARDIAMALPTRVRMAVAAWTRDALRRNWLSRGTYRSLVYDELGSDSAADDWDHALPDPYRLFMEAGGLEINNRLHE